MVSQARFERVCEELLFRHSVEVQQLILMIREMHDSLYWFHAEFKEDLYEEDEDAVLDTLASARYFLQRRSDILDKVPDKISERVIDRLSKEMMVNVDREIKVVERTGTLPNYFGAWEAMRMFDEIPDEIYPDYQEYKAEQQNPGYDDDPYDQDLDE